MCYVSRALTDAERSYSQIEKEALAIVFACEKFYDYIYGMRVTVITDHKPLERIHKKLINDAPRRLQRLLVTIRGFDLDIVWKPGKEMLIADQLSR